MKADPHRPAYHFVSPEPLTWPGDPNGAIWWRGRYHLMYIFQRRTGGGIEHCWGHASSPDLVCWTPHPPALVPGVGDPDRHIFSGNALVGREGQALLLYHGVGAGNCLAEAVDDQLLEWRKLAGNPIVPIPPKGSPEEALYASWDPHGWVENDRYRAIFGGKRATLFGGEELTGWRYEGPLLARELPDVDDFEDISCPDFFALGGRQALLCISHARGCRLYLGEWDGRQFQPERHQRMNWPGGTNFAPESLLAPDGRRLFWTWVIDPRPRAAVEAGGWSGVMSLPRELELGMDGEVRIRPARELEALRGRPVGHSGGALAAGDTWPMPTIPGDRVEIDLSFTAERGSVCSLEVRRSPDGAETTPLVVDLERGELRIELGRSSLDPTVVHRTYCIGRDPNPAVSEQVAPFAPPAGQPIHLRVFLDGSIVELYVNDRICLTQRLFPTRADSLGVAFGVRQGSAHLASLTAWPLSAIRWQS